MTTVIKYPFDPSGVSTTNLVQGETKLLPRVRNRAWGPNYGIFYVDSLVLTHIATGEVLDPVTDYECLGHHSEASILTGKNVCSVIYVTNPAYADDFVYDYQVVGGELYTSAEAIEQLITALENDGRSVSWSDIINAPIKMPPTNHLHDVNDLYGMEHVVEAIDELTAAILVGDVELKDTIIAKLDAVQAAITVVQSNQTLIQTDISRLKDRLTAIGA